MKTELASHVGSEFSSRSLVNVSRIRCKLSQPDKIQATSHFYDLLCCDSDLGTQLLVSMKDSEERKYFKLSRVYLCFRQSLLL